MKRGAWAKRRVSRRGLNNRGASHLSKAGRALRMRRWFDCNLWYGHTRWCSMPRHPIFHGVALEVKEWPKL